MQNGAQFLPPPVLTAMTCAKSSLCSSTSFSGTGTGSALSIVAFGSCMLMFVQFHSCGGTRGQQPRTIAGQSRWRWRSEGDGCAG